MAVDPIRGTVLNPQLMVAYTFVLNNPLRFVDPLGLSPLTAQQIEQLARDLGGFVRWDDDVMTVSSNVNPTEFRRFNADGMYNASGLTFLLRDSLNDMCCCEWAVFKSSGGAAAVLEALFSVGAVHDVLGSTQAQRQDFAQWFAQGVVNGMRSAGLLSGSPQVAPPTPPNPFGNNIPGLGGFGVGPFGGFGMGLAGGDRDGIRQPGVNSQQAQIPSFFQPLDLSLFENPQLGHEQAQSNNTSAFAMALPLAGAIAIADGPSPLGFIVAGLILLAAYLGPPMTFNQEIPASMWVGVRVDVSGGAAVPGGRVIEQDLEQEAGRHGQFACAAAADEMSSILRGANRNHQYVELQFGPLGVADNQNRIIVTTISGGSNPAFIPGSIISEGGYHVGILYNNLVRCNVHTTGLLLENWVADFSGPAGATYAVNIGPVPMGPVRTLLELFP